MNTTKNFVPMYNDPFYSKLSPYLVMSEKMNEDNNSTIIVN